MHLSNGINQYIFPLGYVIHRSFRGIRIYYFTATRNNGPKRRTHRFTTHQTGRICSNDQIVGALNIIVHGPRSSRLVIVNNHLIRTGSRAATGTISNGPAQDVFTGRKITHLGARIVGVVKYRSPLNPGPGPQCSFRIIGVEARSAATNHLVASGIGIHNIPVHNNHIGIVAAITVGHHPTENILTPTQVSNLGLRIRRILYFSTARHQKPGSALIFPGFFSLHEGLCPRNHTISRSGIHRIGTGIKNHHPIS